MRTDMTKLMVYFCSFSKAPKTWPDVPSHRALCLEHAVCYLLLLYSSSYVYTLRKFPNVSLCIVLILKTAVVEVKKHISSDVPTEAS